MNQPYQGRVKIEVGWAGEGWLIGLVNLLEKILYDSELQSDHLIRAECSYDFEREVVLS